MARSKFNNLASLEWGRSSSGFAIMEVLVAVGLLAVASYGVMELISVQQKNTLSARIVSSRDMIKALLSRYVGDPRALDLSSKFIGGSQPYPANTMLNNCVDSVPAANDCVANTVYSMTLLDPQGRVVAGDDINRPAIYDEMGAPCAGVVASQRCPLIAIASFTADCGGPAQCRSAKFITVRFTLQKSPSVAQLRAGGELRLISGDATSGVPFWSTNSGAPNYIAKWASSTALVSSIIYEDPANGRIGMGTTTPIVALTVSGDLTATGNIFAGDQAVANNFFTTINGSPASRGSIVSAFSNGYAVGLGKNSINETGIGILRNSNQMAGAIFYDPMTSRTAIKSYYGQDIGFITTQPVWPGPGDDYRMVIKGSTGRVGIGVVTPTSALSISGDVSITRNIVAGDLVQANNLTATVFNTRPGTIVSAFGTGYAVAIGQNTQNQTGIGISNNAGPLASYYYSPNPFGDMAVLHSYRGRDLVLTTETNAGSPPNSQTYIKGTTGYVGVGTNSPTHPLHILANMNNGSVIKVTNTNGANGYSGVQFTDSAGTHTGSVGWDNGGGNNTYLAAEGNRVVGLWTNNVRRLTVAANGGVGIGTGNPSTALHVIGDITVSGTITSSSDERYKKNVNLIEDVLNKILKLEGRTYYWKDKKRGEDRQIGFIAQQVEKIFPELVKTDNEGYKSINYGAFTVPLVEAVKELFKMLSVESEKVKKLEEKIKALEAQNKISEDQIKILQERMNKIENRK